MTYGPDNPYADILVNPDPFLVSCPACTVEYEHAALPGDILKCESCGARFTYEVIKVEQARMELVGD